MDLTEFRPLRKENPMGQARKDVFPPFFKKTASKTKSLDRSM